MLFSRAKISAIEHLLAFITAIHDALQDLSEWKCTGAAAAADLD
jgi:hypothetical protein